MQFTDAVNDVNSPKAVTTIKATSGKLENRANFCRADIQTLQELLAQCISEFDKYMLKTKALLVNLDNINETVGGINNFVKSNTVNNVQNTLNSFVRNRVIAGQNSARRVLRQAQDVCNPNKPESMVMSIASMLSFDFGLATPYYSEYLKNMKDIIAKATKIKIENQSAITEVTVGGGGYTVAPPELKSFQKAQFDIKIYLVFPDNTKHNIEQYVKQMTITTDFDNQPTPIYSVMFLLPQTIYTEYKNHMENIKWFMTVHMYSKVTDRGEEKFEIPVLIKDNEEFIAVDPQLGPVNNGMKDSVDAMQPIYPLKIDLISAREFQINGIVNAQVFNDCKIIDVVTALCSQLRKQYADNGDINTKDLVTYAISPPDNTAKYEQIIISPGSFTETIQKLQMQYGIYKTGVRIAFDAHHVNSDGKMSKFITITEKGGTAPTKETLTDALVEVVDMKEFRNTVPEHGYLIDKSSNVVVYRTFDNYDLVKKNSTRFIHGDNIRVMNSSQSSNNISICDTTSINDNQTQKLYWSKYDNPFNLTQLQDAVREQNQTVTLTLRDVNVFGISDNVKYAIKFYSKDDPIATGRYRLVRSIAYLRATKGLSPMNRVEMETALLFYNIPELRENGAPVVREEYSEKVSKMDDVETKSKEAPEVKPVEKIVLLPSKATPPNGTPVVTNPITEEKVVDNTIHPDTPPFKTNFAGKKDFLGVIVPDNIPLGYKMSPNVTIMEATRVYERAYALANNFTAFINTQRFCQEVIEPIYAKFGKSFLFTLYKTKADSSVARQYHVLGLAVRTQLGDVAGSALVENFLKLCNDKSFVFHHLVLEGDGTEWDNVLITKNMNDTNKRSIMINASGVYNDYASVLPGALARWTADPKLLTPTTFRETL